MKLHVGNYGIVSTLVENEFSCYYRVVFILDLILLAEVSHMQAHPDVTSSL